MSGEFAKMYDFTGRTIIVTGGTGVLCGAMAQALSGCGANVAILGRDKKKGAAVLEKFTGPGRGIMVAADVLDSASLKAAAEKIISEFGSLDGLSSTARAATARRRQRGPSFPFSICPKKGCAMCSI
jgi:NAD(P)-dependent dehydrogenase (short-subunit alcohol dehydrogenase family)